MNDFHFYFFMKVKFTCNSFYAYNMVNEFEIPWLMKIFKIYQEMISICTKSFENMYINLLFRLQWPVLYISQN